MNTQSEMETGAEQKRLRLRRMFGFVGFAGGFVLLISSMGFVVASNVNLCEMVEIAGIGPGLYAQALELPRS
jgi:hypothetical protein